MPANGLTAEQFARAAENAYRDAGIYARPAIEVELVGAAADRPQQEATGGVGGRVRRAGPIRLFRKER